MGEKNRRKKESGANVHENTNGGAGSAKTTNEVKRRRGKTQTV